MSLYTTRLPQKLSSELLVPCVFVPHFLHWLMYVRLQTCYIIKICSHMGLIMLQV